MMSNDFTPRTQSAQPGMYEIRVAGQLTSEWSDWFGGMTIVPQANGETLLTGMVVDQAALYGLLKKVRDLGTPLVSVNRVDTKKVKETKMNKLRWTAILVGVLYIIGTVSGILSVVVTGSLLDAPGSPEQISANANQIILGALFVLTMGLALAMVPVLMYPVLKKHNQVLALGYVVFRGALETVAYMAMVVSWLSLVKISQGFAQAGIPAASGLQALGVLILDGHDATRSVLEIVFPLGALMFYSVLYQSKLIPRWLSGWGLLAAIVWFAAGLLGTFQLIVPMSPLQLALSFPIFLQEMVMAVWFIVKGFNPAAVALVSDSTEMPRNKLAHSAA